MSVSILTQKDKKENNQSSQSSLGGLKHKSHRILKPVANANSFCFNDQQITQQLMQEFSRIKELIQKYQLKKKSFDLPFKQGDVVKQIISLEEIIISTDKQIKEINQEIKDLKSAKNQSDSNAPKKQITDSQLFQLTEELKRQRTDLFRTIEDHSNQVNKYQHIKKAIRKLQSKHIEKFSERLISYQDFKLKSQQTTKDNNSKKKKIRERKMILSKEKLETSLQNILNPKTESSSRNMKELQSKKIITQTALKNSKKKHRGEIVQLNAKLEFLRDEDAHLNERIEKIESQKSLMEAKFKVKFNKNSKYSNNYTKESPSFLNNFAVQAP